MMYGGWGGWIAGSLVMVGFWVLLFWAIVSLARRPADAGSRRPSAEQILADRFARGEIDAAEYQERRHAIRSQ